MTALPEADEIAALVSNVTQMMCGATFVPGDPTERGDSLCAQMAVITLQGEPPISVVFTSDAQGSRALGSAFLGCSPQDLTRQMIDDVTSELLNMVAGQLSAALGHSHSLGLPRRTTVEELAQAAGDDGFENEILLRSEGKVDLGLWILESRAKRRRNTGGLAGLFR